MSDTNKSVKIGAGWTKEGKSGNAWVSVSLDMTAIAGVLEEVSAAGGKVDKLNVGMFENTKKKSDNQPDYYFMYFRRDAQ